MPKGIVPYLSTKQNSSRLKFLGGDFFTTAIQKLFSEQSPAWMSLACMDSANFSCSSTLLKQFRCPLVPRRGKELCLCYVNTSVGCGFCLLSVVFFVRLLETLAYFVSRYSSFYKARRFNVFVWISVQDILTGYRRHICKRSRPLARFSGLPQLLYIDFTKSNFI